MRASDLESLLRADHRARHVWGYVTRQDLSKLFESVKARGSNADRTAIDPRVLFALWLYATLQGLGRSPDEWLVDGGLPAHEQIDAVADKTEVYAPIPEARPKKGAQGEPVPQDKYEAKPGDSAAVVGCSCWRTT